MDLEIYEPLIIRNSTNNVKEEDLEIYDHSEYDDEYLDFMFQDFPHSDEQEENLLTNDFKLDISTLIDEVEKRTDDHSRSQSHVETKGGSKPHVMIKKMKFDNNCKTLLPEPSKKRRKGKCDLQKPQKYQMMTLKNVRKKRLKNVKKKDADIQFHSEYMDGYLDSKLDKGLSRKRQRDLKNKDLKTDISHSNAKDKKKTDARNCVQTAVPKKTGRELRVMVEKLKSNVDGKVIVPKPINLLPTPKVKPPKPVSLQKRTHYSVTLKRVEIKSGKKAKFGITKKGNPQLHLAGYIYNRKAGTQNGTVYWKCTKLLCRSWVKQKGKTFLAPTKHELCVPYEIRKPKERAKKIRHYCSFCDRSFAKKSTWRVHERTHTGEKPYCCDICNVRFAASGGLIKHNKRHHDKAFQMRLAEIRAQ